MLYLLKLLFNPRPNFQWMDILIQLVGELKRYQALLHLHLRTHYWKPIEKKNINSHCPWADLIRSIFSRSGHKRKYKLSIYNPSSHIENCFMTIRSRRPSKGLMGKASRYLTRSILRFKVNNERSMEWASVFVLIITHNFWFLWK